VWLLLLLLVGGVVVENKSFFDRFLFVRRMVAGVGMLVRGHAKA
jgi:hypothetical protein